MSYNTNEVWIISGYCEEGVLEKMSGLLLYYIYRKCVVIDIWGGNADPIRNEQHDNILELNNKLMFKNWQRAFFFLR